MSLDTKVLDGLVPKLQSRLRAVVRKSAFDAQAIAQQQAPRDTGALANSIYVATAGASEYEQKKEAVKQAAPKAELFDEISTKELDFQAAKISAVLAVMVHYGIYLEFGTARQPAQPFFISAVSLVEPNFRKACKKAIEKAAEKV